MYKLNPFPKQPTILIVDDTPENLRVTSSLLEDHYRVKVANNGEKALRIVRSNDPPDLILLDIMMPGLDGYEVCRQLQADTITKHIPIIFVTSLVESEDEKHGLDIGAVDYIYKPINPSITLARIKTHLHLKEMYDSLQEKNILIETQIELGRSLQEVILPKPLPKIENAKVNYIYNPIEHLSGDFLDFYYSASRSKLGFFICDVSGHGVPSSMITTMVKISLNEWGETLEYPIETLKKMQGQLKGKLGDYFLTSIIGCLDLKTGHVVVANAGHPPAIILNHEGVIILEKGGTILGDDIEGEFTQSEFDLKSRDILLLYTDGIYDFPGKGGDGALWKWERFIQFMRSQKFPNIESIGLEIIQRIEDLNDRKTAWRDDITIMALQYL